MSKPHLSNNLKIPDKILPELLTPSELRMLKNRWQIIKLLEDGLSVRQAAREAKVGTDTVVRTARIRKNIFTKNLQESVHPRRQVKSTWIFGQSS